MQRQRQNLIRWKRRSLRLRRLPLPRLVETLAFLRNTANKKSILISSYTRPSITNYKDVHISRGKYLDPYNVDVQVMTTSERLLVGGSKTPPDTAPRLPPKPGKCWNQGWTNSTRIESRCNIVQFNSH